MVAAKWASSLYSLTWNIDWFNKYIVLRTLGGLLPGNWLLFENIGHEAFKNPNGSLNLSGLVSQSYMTLSGPSVWIGAAAGVAMIFIAVRMRRWKDEG